MKTAAVLLLPFATTIAFAEKPPEPTIGTDYSIVFDHYAGIPLKSGYVLTDAPSLAKTSDGALLCSVPLMLHHGEPEQPVGPLLFFRSEDGGQSWTKLPVESDFCSGTLFPHDGVLYFIGTGPHHREDSNMKIIRSDDDGHTWTDPSVLFEGKFYNPSTGYVVRNGTFYWCMDEDRSDTYVIAADLSKELLDRSSWRVSSPLPKPELPGELNRTGQGGGLILEGNVVEVNGRLQVSWRYRTSADSAGIGVICDLEDDGKTLDYRFRQFHALPGSQCQFHILRDPVTGLYWRNATLPTKTQDPDFSRQLRENPHYVGGSGNERRILALFCSFDALNWLPAGYIVVWPELRQSSNYCGLLIDGQDLLVVSRTSRAGRNQHDNDLTTFHRLHNFRERAAFLLPGAAR